MNNIGFLAAAGLGSWLGGLLLTVLNAALVGVIGWLLIRLLLNLLGRLLHRTTRIDPLLHNIIITVTRIALLVLLAISVLDALGVPTTSIVTSVGAVGLAISLAVKDSISSLAGGIVVLIIKPFGLGDYVEVDGTAGTVQEITLFSTVLTTLDNKRVSIPNNEVAGAKIVNYSAEEKRRVEVTFSIGYGDDYDRARALILRAIDETGLALSEPAPVVRMSGHGASPISIVTRVWVKNADFAEMTFQLYERVKKLFDENGISIPYDQLDVHLTHTGS